MPLRNVLRCSLISLFCCFAAGAAQPGDVPFPSGYREWMHVKSVLIGAQSPAFAGSGGLHHIYANEQAMTGYRTGRFPTGAVIVFDLLDVVEKDGITSEGARARIDVMQLNGSGVWEFGRFMKGLPAERFTDAAAIAQCTTCHKNAPGGDFVFSEYRE